MDMDKVPAFQDFMQLLSENDRPQQAQDLSVMAWYLDGMERQLDAALLELQEVKRQLAEQQAPSKGPLARMMDTLTAQLEQTKQRLSAFRDKIVSCARDGTARFKDMGVSALDAAVTAMGVKKGLEHLQESLQESIAGAKTAVERGEQMGRELRSAGKHVKDAFRAAAGKETRQQDVALEGRFQAAVLAPMRGVEKLLSHLNNNALAAIGAVEHLEQRAEDAREHQTERAEQKPGRRLARKPSIRQAIQEKRAMIAAAKTAPAPEKEKKAQEAAL